MKVPLPKRDTCHSPSPDTTTDNTEDKPTDPTEGLETTEGGSSKDYLIINDICLVNVFRDDIEEMYEPGTDMTRKYWSLIG